jgi:hypothetical protein
VSKARQAYDSCDWAKPSPEELTVLASPPTKEEIAQKLNWATNTAPGANGIEYRDIIKLDPGRGTPGLNCTRWFGALASPLDGKDHSNLQKRGTGPGRFQQLLANLPPLHALQGLVSSTSPSPLIHFIHL